MIRDPGDKFENLIALSLLRMAARFTEMGWGDYHVHYIRDREKREVDFVLVRDNKPLALFEAKESDSRISKSGRYFSQKMEIPLYQIVRIAQKAEVFPESCAIIPASNFLLLAG